MMEAGEVGDSCRGYTKLLAGVANGSSGLFFSLGQAGRREGTKDSSEGDLGL